MTPPQYVTKADCNRRHYVKTALQAALLTLMGVFCTLTVMANSASRDAEAMAVEVEKRAAAVAADLDTHAKVQAAEFRHITQALAEIKSAVAKQKGP